MPPHKFLINKMVWLGVLLGLLAAAAPALAQQPAKAPPTAAGLKKSFARIEAGTEGESEAFDKLVATTSRQLVAYLKTHDVTKAEAEKMGLGYLDCRDAAHLKVFTYTYSSGGTRGTVNRPIFQWQNAAGQRFAYRSGEEWGFQEIYKLASPGRTQYLLLGGETGDGRCFSNQACVVELKGDYLLVDNAAFGKSPSLRVCNVEMQFDPGRQLLHLDLSDTEVPEYNDDDWAQLGYQRLPGAKSLTLKFSGGRFVVRR